MISRIKKPRKVSFAARPASSYPGQSSFTGTATLPPYPPELEASRNATSPQQAGAATASEPHATRPAQTRTETGEEERSVKSQHLGREEIKVHGHWVLDLKDRAGKLVEHREFDSLLLPAASLPSGAQVLAALLGGEGVNGTPGIGLVSGSFNPPLPSDFYYGPPAGSLRCFAFEGQKSPLVHSGTSYAFYSEQHRRGTGAALATAENWVLSGRFPVPVGLGSVSAIQTLMPLSVRSEAPFLGGANFVPSFGAVYDRNTDLAPSAFGRGNGSSADRDYVVQLALTSTKVPGAMFAVTPGQTLSVSIAISIL